MFWALEQGGEFHYRHGGRVKTLPAAVDLPDVLLIQVLTDISAWIQWTTPEPGAPMWAIWEIRDAYCLSQGLPLEDADITHLVSMVDRYGEALEVDLLNHGGLDLIELWRARRWRRLLNVIDRLPQASHYSEQMLNDREVVLEIKKRQHEREKREGKKRVVTGTPVSQYTTEVSMLRDIINAVNSLRAAVIAANGGKPGETKPYPGPITLLDSAEHEIRQSEHESLVARVMPGKRAPTDG